MKRRFQFILCYYLFWTILFLLGRLYFLWQTNNTISPLPANDVWKTMVHGIRMDLSVAAYFTLPVLMMLIAGMFIRFFNIRTVYVGYSFILLLLSELIFLIDSNVFNAWGYRLEANALIYLKSPKEAWASVSNLPVFWMITGLIMLVALTTFAFIRLIRRYIPFVTGNRFVLIPVLLITGGAMIVPMRGGLQLVPINQSSVYFSSNNYSNQVALNPVWNFVHSVLHNRNLNGKEFDIMPSEKALNLVGHLFLQDTTEIIKTSQPENVILVVWESFTSKVLDKVYHGVEITPNFNRLKNEGLYFDHIYATGDRTDKGIVGILSGYPSQPTNSIVKHPEKSRTLPMLTKTLSSKGYFTSFYYGGEPEFANIKSYLLQGELNEMADVHAFAEKDRNSKWGAHDGVVMDYVSNRLKVLPQPFFATWLTLSSHEPYETPVPVSIPGDDDVSLFLNSLHYTDDVLGQFVSKCKLMPWWNNTVLVVVADHGHRFPLSNNLTENFHIPVLFLGGGISPRTVPSIGSQTDLASTLLNYLGYSSSMFHISRNMLAPQYHPWAWFSFNNGFGYLKPGRELVFDNVGKRPIQKQGSVDESMILEGRALQQVFYTDFLSRGTLGETVNFKP